MSKRNKNFSGIVHHSTMVKWIAFGYLMYARNMGVDITKAAQEFCNDPLVNDEGNLNSNTLRQEFYRTLERLMDARSQSTSDSSEQGAAGNGGGLKTGL